MGLKVISTRRFALQPAVLLLAIGLAGPKGLLDAASRLGDQRAGKSARCSGRRCSVVTPCCRYNPIR